MEIDLSVRIDDAKTLWLTEVSRQTFYDQGLESLESDSGLFVVLEDTANGAFEILAKAASPASGISLFNLFARSIGPKVVDA